MKRAGPPLESKWKCEKIASIRAFVRVQREKESYDISERADNCLNNPETRARVRTKTCPLFQPPVWMPLASPATPARNRRARLASQPHLAWVFALQGANQNLSAFFSRKTEASYPAMNSAPDPSDYAVAACPASPKSGQVSEVPCQEF